MKNFPNTTFEYLGRLSVDATAQAQMYILIRGPEPKLGAVRLDLPLASTFYSLFAMRNRSVYGNVEMIVDLDGIGHGHCNGVINRPIRVGPSSNVSYLKCCLNLGGVLEDQEFG